MEHKKSRAENLINELKEFKRLQIQYSHFGASDTEPDEVFQWKIKDFVDGKLDKELPKGNAWQLFSSVYKWESIADKLTDQLAIIQALFVLLPMGELEQVKQYAKDNYWRTY